MRLAKVCGKEGQRKRRMAIASSIFGGLIGAAASQDNPLVGAAVGGAAGAALGSLIGSAWDKEACRKSQEAVALALATGETQSWTSGDGSKSFSYAVDRRYAGDQRFSQDLKVVDGRSLVLDDMVVATGVVRVSAARANIRSQPDLSGASQIVDSFPANTPLLVMGATGSEEWLLVSSGGEAAEGWIRADMVTRTEDPPAGFSRVSGRAVRVEKVAARQQCIGGREVFVLGDKRTETEQAYCTDASGTMQPVST